MRQLLEAGLGSLFCAFFFLISVASRGSQILWGIWSSHLCLWLLNLCPPGWFLSWHWDWWTQQLAGSLFPVLKGCLHVRSETYHSTVSWLSLVFWNSVIVWAAYFTSNSLWLLRGAKTWRCPQSGQFQSVLRFRLIRSQILGRQLLKYANIYRLLTEKTTRL